MAGNDSNLQDDYLDHKTKAANTYDPRVVAAFHRMDDVDVAKDSHHHTIGIGSNQSAAGSHIHNGSDSPQLLAGVSLTGSRGAATAMPGIIAALVALGATDNTTA